MLRSPWSPAALLLVLLMAVGSVVMWIGVPLGPDLPRLADRGLLAPVRRPVPAGADRAADRDGDRRQVPRLPRPPARPPDRPPRGPPPRDLAALDARRADLDPPRRRARQGDDRLRRRSRCVAFAVWFFGFAGSLACRPAERRRRPSRARRIPGVHVIVLGIDPGVANTGYGIVAHDRGRLVALDGGVIETRRGPGRGRAPRRTSTRASASCWTPTSPTRSRSRTSTSAPTRARAFAVGQARGVVILAAGQRDDPLRVLHAPAGQGRGLRLRPSRPRSRCSAWSRRCSRCPSCPSPTTRPTRSRSRSATPTARRCRPRSAKVAA